MRELPQRPSSRISSALWLCLALSTPLPAEDDDYLREEIPLPDGVVMEIGSIAILPEKKVAVSTRRGDIWIVEGAYEADLSQVKWTLFAQGLHEPFGMFYRDGSLILTQRPEVTKITDLDHDGRADRFETISQNWGINGDYHEYAFGSDADAEGNMWVVLCLTGSGGAESDWRGWAMQISPDGTTKPFASGIRSPGGIGFNHTGDLFYTDNQGPWNGSSSLKWIKPGSFQGNPTGNKYHELAGFPTPPTPADESRLTIERAKFPDLIPPAVILPHGKLGQSPTAIIPIEEGVSFGPFTHQLLIGEQTHSQIQRVFLEKVNGLYQGAAWHFLEGFRAGIVPMRMGEDSTLFIGGTSRGWASRGGKSYTFERVRWTGKIPFEMHEVRAKPDGFEITFTHEIDPASAQDLASYAIKTWTYIYQSKYGSPEVDETTPTIDAISLAEDHRSIRLKVSGLVKGHVHHLQLPGLRDRDGKALWHPEVYYTLNEIPE